MNMKTLLGTAAGLMVATGAYAADLPGEAAPAAVDYVKVCDAYGAGFFYIPGTETCLDISGRVRARVTYTNSDAGDSVQLRTDGRIQFDARTASDLGTVRSFFETDLSGESDNNGGNVLLGDAFIQVGYLTVGKFGDIANGGSFYGDRDVLWDLFDMGGVGAQVLVDNLGGGFYIGAGVHGDGARDTVWATTTSADLTYAAAVGIAGQSWGGFDLSGVYNALDGGDNDTYGIKATADLKLIDKLDARLSASYQDFGVYDDSYIGLAAALKYQATDALAVYAGVGANLWDDADESITAQIGADYAFTPDLILTAEANYQGDGGWASAGVPTTDDTWTGMLKLTRNW